MTEAKARLESYFLKKCRDSGIDYQTYDFKAEIGEDITYQEGVTLLEENFFSKVTAEEVSANLIYQQQMAEKKAISEEAHKELEKNRDNFQQLSKASSIYILGSTGTGKSALAYGLCKKLQKYKRIYYHHFPKTSLLQKEGWHNLENLNDVGRLTDSVLVVDEAALKLRRDEKRNNDLLQKLLVLARQNNITLIIISQLSQVVNKALESLIDCFIVMDIDYNNLKNGSRTKIMIRNYCTFSPEAFKLKVGEFLYFSRNYSVFDNFVKFPKPEGFTEEWSFAYRSTTELQPEQVEDKIGVIEW